MSFPVWHGKGQEVNKLKSYAVNQLKVTRNTFRDPIIAAVTEVEVESQLLSEENASLLVAAGSVTVLIFPFIANMIQPAETPATSLRTS